MRGQNSSIHSGNLNILSKSEKLFTNHTLYGENNSHFNSSLDVNDKYSQQIYNIENDLDENLLKHTDRSQSIQLSCDNHRISFESRKSNYCGKSKIFNQRLNSEAFNLSFLKEKNINDNKNLNENLFKKSILNIEKPPENRKNAIYGNFNKSRIEIYNSHLRFNNKNKDILDSTQVNGFNSSSSTSCINKFNEYENQKFFEFQEVLQNSNEKGNVNLTNEIQSTEQLILLDKNRLIESNIPKCIFTKNDNCNNEATHSRENIKQTNFFSYKSKSDVCRTKKTFYIKDLLKD